MSSAAQMYSAFALRCSLCLSWNIAISMMNGWMYELMDVKIHSLSKIFDKL